MPFFKEGREGEPTVIEPCSLPSAVALLAEAEEVELTNIHWHSTQSHSESIVSGYALETLLKWLSGSVLTGCAKSFCVVRRACEKRLGIDTESKTHRDAGSLCVFYLQMLDADLTTSMPEGTSFDELVWVDVPGVVKEKVLVSDVVLAMAEDGSLAILKSRGEVVPVREDSMLGRNHKEEQC